MSENITKRYFVASNSAEGFKSYYERVFCSDKLASLYVIKGGPGTGKSRFMREVADKACEAGYSVTYIHCSFDPTSLDGIIIEELRVAIIDGTAPHEWHVKTAGAFESIIDFGSFWNTSMLSRSRRIIEVISEQKAKSFERGYRYLSAYRQVSKNMEDMVKPYIKLDKIKKFALRFALSVESGEGKEEFGLVNSVGMNGKVGFDTYFEQADVYYRIEDYLECGHVLLSQIRSALLSEGADIIVSPNPILPERLDAIATKREGLTFEISEREDESARVINMKRFIDASMIPSVRGSWRAAFRTRESLFDMASLEFKNVKKYHFTLEEIYGAAMDFEAKEQYTSEFCKKILEK